MGRLICHYCAKDIKDDEEFLTGCIYPSISSGKWGAFIPITFHSPCFDLWKVNAVIGKKIREEMDNIIKEVSAKGWL